MTSEAPRKYVAYYRVSTDRQGMSGLGLEAQQEAVERFIEAHSGELLASFVEVESGAKKRRPKLEQAIDRCQSTKAILLIAKLDRLARNVHFISGLMESRVEFVAADNPHATKLMIHLLAAFAEHEREVISERTRAALAAAKMRGVKLGQNGKHLAARNKRLAHEHALSLIPHIEQLQGDGHKSYRSMALALNAKGICSATGGKWHAATIKRVLARLSDCWFPLPGEKDSFADDT